MLKDQFIIVQSAIIYPPKKNLTTTLVSCKCCEDRYDKQPKLKTIFGVI